MQTKKKAALYISLPVFLGITYAAYKIYPSTDVSDEVDGLADSIADTANRSRQEYDGTNQTEPNTQDKPSAKSSSDINTTLSALESDVKNATLPVTSTNNGQPSLSELFQLEEYDISWAPEQEEEIRSINNPKLFLNVVECKSTLCKLHLLSYYEGDRPPLGELLDSVPGKSAEYAITWFDNGASFEMYLKRKTK